MYVNKIGGEIKFTAEKVLPSGHPLSFTNFTVLSVIIQKQMFFL